VFLQECLRLGYDAIGVEADNTLREVISQTLLDRVIFSPAEKIDTFDQPFDVVTFWDSFEHLTGGFEILDKLKNCLNKDGIIYLRVNNNYDIANLLTLSMLALFPRLGKKMLKLCFGFPHHAWNFSKNGMNNLLAKKRWQVISCCFNETPASRFTKNIFLRGIIELAYLFNRIIRGGKIGEYYIAISAKK
jgi:2-polyprenyl-3-methyl-5-hydroxy-6-metoxy-1,4-benzoquinol methylase